MRKSHRRWRRRINQRFPRFNAQLTARDQKDWLNQRLDQAGVRSSYARRALIADVMSEEGGLPWKKGEFVGFNDFLTSAIAKDASLVQKPEEGGNKKPAIVGKTGSDEPEKTPKRIPRLF